MLTICRACLQDVDKSSYFYIDTFDNTQISNTIPKDVLQLCVPEMDLYISEQPGICSDCLNMFESFYNFKNKCLASEERILTYLKKNRVSTQDKVNLMYVVHDIKEETSNHETTFSLENNDEGIDHCQEFLLNYSNDCPQQPNNDSKEVFLLSCNDCSFVTLEEEKLVNHKCISSLDKYKCPYCPYSTNRRYRLSYHINAKHTKTKWYNCDQCEYKTTDPSSLRRHQKVIHYINREENVQVFNCTKCEFFSPSEVSLQRHQVSKHGPVIQCCQICQYQTKDKSNFRKHLFIHGEKPRKCTQCNYQCVSPYQLEKHYKKSHM